MTRPRNHGYAALAPEDVADAKAGTAGVDLHGYAAERGLELLSGTRPAGYDAAVPRWPDYMENLMRGVLPGGEYGLLLHEKLELAPGAGMSGTLYGIRTGRASWKDLLPSFNRTDIPLIGDFLAPPTDKRPPEPFDGEGPWIPCTLAVTRVPSTTVVLPALRIDRRRHHAQYDFADHRTLEGGWHVRTGPGTDEAALGRLLAGPLAGLLRASADVPLLQIVVHLGTLQLRRNGYLKDDAELDAHARTAAFVAGELRAACLPAARREPFADPLPPWDAREAELPGPWIEAFQGLAARLGMTLEDPDALHRAHPSLELPGRAVCVMRGPLPDLPAGRLVYTAERLVRRAQVVRGAVLLAAAPGVETPLGGLRDEDPVVAEVRDGVVSCWSRRTADRTFGEVDQLIAASARAVRRHGLAAAL